MYKLKGIDKLPIKYAISTKADGNMSFVWGNKGDVIKNRTRFLVKNGFDINDCVTVRTTNSQMVKVVSARDKNQGMVELETALNADGMMVSESDISLFLMVADCVPTIFFDRKKNILALVHINGMNPGIIKETINSFAEHSSDINDLIVSTGPAIGKDTFIVDDPFQRRDIEWKGYFTDLPNSRTAIDMIGFLHKKFLEEGIKEENLFMSEVDTFKEAELFSHRRSAETGETEGRFAVAVKIV